MQVPPERGNTAASWAEERALQSATKAPMAKDASRAGPAMFAAGAITAKMPAPKIAASPVAIVSNILNCERSLALRASSVNLAYSPLYIANVLFCSDPRLMGLPRSSSVESAVEFPALAQANKVSV